MLLLHRTTRLVIASLMGLSPWLPTASGHGMKDFGAPAQGDLVGACPTRFDYEVLASAADSGNLIGLSAYRFRRETRYSISPLGEFQRVAERRADVSCQGGSAAGMRASAAPRRSSQIT
jgi:hypothetical protein